LKKKLARIGRLEGKPPDKEIKVELISLRLKEVNQLKNKIRINKKIIRERMKNNRSNKKQLMIESLSYAEMLLEKFVKQNTREVIFCSVRNDIDELKLEQEVLEHQYRVLILNLIISKNWSNLKLML
jgi:adenine-specific DNA methylase